MDGIVYLLGLLITGVIGGLFVVIKTLFARMGKLEKRQDALETAIRAEQAKSAQLRLLLERVCTGYETVRRELLKVARIARQGKEISDDHMVEIEATPNIEALLSGLGIKI